MARQFNGINQSLQSVSSVNLSAQSVVTIVFWLWWDAFVDDDDLAVEFSANYNSANGFIIDPNQAGSAFLIGVSGTAGSLYWLDTFPRPSAAAWHHYIVEFNRTTPENKVWVDNSIQSLNAISHSLLTGTMFDSDVLYVMSRGNSTLFGAGRLHELAIYSGSLTSQNRSDLQTKSPSIVGSALFQWPLCGVSSPEPSVTGGVDLTVNGATQVADPLALVGSTCIGASVGFPFAHLRSGEMSNSGLGNRWPG